MLERSMTDVVTIDGVPEAAAPVETRSQPLPAAVAPRWNLATRVAFRFCFLYFSLYVVSTQMLGGLLPFSWIRTLGGSPPMRGAISWVGAHIFHLGAPVSFQVTGSGDKMADYLQVFVMLVAAAVATAIWSIVDRRRPGYQALNKWFRLFLRFALGATMVSYGMVKAVPLQMPAPGLQRLLEPFGNFSPMGVLWYSIGASKSYEMFAGSMELVSGILLFIPFTATLGAMVTFATAVQIFTLNMTYDIPVKLFSFELILMSLFLIAPEATRLASVILGRAAGPSRQPPLVRRRFAAIAAVVFQLGYGGYLVWMNYGGARESWTTRGGGAPKSPLYGIWNIEKMTIDGHERSALVTDYARWRRVFFPNPAGMTFQRMDDSFLGYSVKIDTAAKTIAVTATPNAAASPFTFEQPDADRLILDGTLDGHKLRMETRRFDLSRFLLLTRGFNWIQERPFNR